MPLLTSLLALTALVGCDADARPEEDAAITELVERGPFRFELRLEPKDPWVGDPIRITLDVHTREGYAVRFPDADAFGELEILDTQTTDPRPADAGLLWQQTVTAESYLSGELEIPPLVVRYGPEPAPDEAFEAENELVTHSIKLTVRSALTSQDSVESPRDITGTLTPPQPPLKPWQWAVIGLAAAVAVGLLAALLWWLNRLAKRPAPPIPAEVLALRALSQLRAAARFERGEMREFYYELSEIVRMYVERKFSLAAPEMTTEEFLGELARDRGALPYDAQRLRAFLESCDAVKYAAFDPVLSEAVDAVSAARAFVDATAAAAARAQAQGAPSGGPAAMQARQPEGHAA